MATQWQYLQDGQTIGPIDEDDLREMLASGDLKPSTPIRCTDLGESAWRPAKSVAEFKTLFAATSIALAAQSAPSPVLVESAKPIVERLQPIPVTIEHKGPVEAITAREEGASVVTWMWRSALMAWAVCFLPIPGLSTFLVWLFAAIAGTLAFVALFKNRVGAGIAGTIALVLITPAMWFLSLAVYPLLIGSAAVVDAQNQQQRRVQSNSARTQAAVQNQQRQLRQREAQSRAGTKRNVDETVVVGRWRDQDGICEYFSTYSLICHLNSGAPPIERRWSLNGDLLEWHGGAKRYVYRVVELTPQQMILENVLPEAARGTRWVENKVN